MDKLVRQDVIDSQRNQNYGSVSINTPVQYMILTMGVSFVIGLVFLFLVKGEFSEKFIVNGYLESTKGIARVYPRGNGVIVKQFVKQGDEIKKGHPLFLINTTDDGLSKKNNVLSQLEKRKKLITSEIISKKNHLNDLKQLLDKKYISLTTYHQKHDELIALQNQKSNIDVDIINYKQQKSYLIRAPVDGVISNILYQEGQSANATKPLVNMLPSHADLRAELFIPVKQAGFLRHKNKVIIRYDAYPYVRFGTVTATIDGVGQSILTDDEEEKPIRIGEPYYKVSALLDNQFVTIYGKNKKIRQGMTFSAVIVGSRKKIWQWILDPLFSFYGGVFS